MAARNALATMKWDFDVPNINNLLQPVQRGYDQGLQDQQRNVENQRADEQLGMQREKLGMAKQSAARAAEAAEAQRIGNIARVIDGEADPTRRAAMIQNLYKGSPSMMATLSKYGVDPNDVANVPKFLMAQAGNYNPLEEEKTRAQIEASKASAAASLAQRSQIKMQTPEARAKIAGQYGLQAGTPEYNAFVLNGTYAPPDPIKDLIRSATQPQQQAAPPPGAPRLQPQSMTGEADQPQIIQAQTAAPQAQPQPTDGSMVETPLGPMSRQRAQTLGFALALQGKGDAGKMLAGEPGLGKTATNNIDDKIVDGLNVLSRMESIQQAFKPEYQTIGTRLGMTGAGWMAMIDPSKVDPETGKKLAEFSVFRRRGVENLNVTIKEITGAAMSIPEAERIRAQVPDPGQPGLLGIASGDDPITFKAKMDDVIKQAKLSIARQAWLKKNNPALLDQLAKRKMEGIENVMPLERMGGVMNERRNQIYQELKQRSPNATREQLLPFVGQQLKQEFGI